MKFEDARRPAATPNRVPRAAVHRLPAPMRIVARSASREIRGDDPDRDGC